jgi:hypothetical protein
LIIENMIPSEEMQSAKFVNKKSFTGYVHHYHQSDPPPTVTA